MAKNYFNWYVWLIDTIRNHGYITFSDISDLWQKASINEDGSYHILQPPRGQMIEHAGNILELYK